ncbi:MAG: helix-turn-helix domain-containing protein [Bacteroidales bacterium]|nr:helix-turn-helix domain-containing protein [Bacteroidales bacterium]MBN2764585.1 helix-turn-helix domain-containing protein [Bacteroidales bacterium]
MVNGMKQHQLARLARISKVQLSNIETGKSFFR